MRPRGFVLTISRDILPLLFELVERAQNRIVFVDAGKHSFAAFDNAEYRKIQGFRAVFCEYQRVFVACSEH